MRSRSNIKWVLILLLGVLSAGVSAQSVKSLVRKGNKKYDQKKYSDAEVLYRKALAKNPKYPKGAFNLGDALYQQKNFKGAENFFQHLAGMTQTPEYLAKAWYNLGNTYMSQKQYEKSIAAFIRSLKLDPQNMDAKYNLTYARKMLKKQKQQQKKNKQNKKNQKKKQNKNQNNQNKKKKEQNKKNQQKKNQNQNQNQQQKKQPRNRPKKQQISPQEAQRILNALKNNEKNTLKKLEKQKAKAVKVKPNVINW